LKLIIMHMIYKPPCGIGFGLCQMLLIMHMIYKRVVNSVLSLNKLIIMHMIYKAGKRSEVKRSKVNHHAYDL